LPLISLVIGLNRYRSHLTAVVDTKNEASEFLSSSEFTLSYQHRKGKVATAQYLFKTPNTILSSLDEPTQFI